MSARMTLKFMDAFFTDSLRSWIGSPTATKTYSVFDFDLLDDDVGGDGGGFPRGRAKRVVGGDSDRCECAEHVSNGGSRALYSFPPP